MGKLLATMVIALVIALAFYFGWFGVSTHSTDDRSGVQFSVDKEKFEEDMGTAGRKLERIGDEAREGARSAGAAEDALHVDSGTLDLAPGARRELKVTRKGENLPAGQLALTSSPDSGLRVTGGELKAGEAQTTVTVEAVPDARGGEVSISLPGVDEDTVKVNIVR